MSYLSQEDPELIEDLLTRKEFYWLQRWDHNKKHSPTADIIPRFMLDNEIAKSGYLKLLGHQQFVENYFNPNTEYKRLHIKWSTGSGKTLAGLAIAMNFIKNYNIERTLGNVEIGSVFIIGFSERAFKNELLRYPEFGFMSRSERFKLDKLKRLASTGAQYDRSRYVELISRIRKRFSNRKGNGFFRFFGYKAFLSRIFVCPVNMNISDLSEEQLRANIASGKITYNVELLKEFKNSLIICDEIHNVYNSFEKNNWGSAIQAILDIEDSIRCVTLSATPLNNNPAEIVDLLNLLLPVKQRVSRTELFTNDKDLKPGALDKIAELSRGRFSFLIDVNPKYYPKMYNIGESLKEIPYLKFIRCPMSPFHYNTYKAVYTGTLSQESQYLIDFALPNPENGASTSNSAPTSNGIGLYQTSQIKKLISNAPQKWKDKYMIDFRDDKIVGDMLLRENIGKYSTKYATMLDEIADVIHNKHGKIFIYHNIVHMSGVYFIEQMLIRNGYLDEYSTSNDNTICMLCGKKRKEHHKDEITGGAYIDSPVDSHIDVTGDILINNVSDNVLRPEVSDDNVIVAYHWISKDVPYVTIHVSHVQNVVNSAQNKNVVKYYISTMSRGLIDTEPDIMKDFSWILESFNDGDFTGRIQTSTGNKLGTWLINNGFTLVQHDGKHSILTRKGKESTNVNVGEVIGEVIGAGHTKHTTKHSTKHTTKHTTKHKFTPVRFIMAHSEIEKSRMEQSIERFNNIENVTGSQFLILVGSRIIKESYDIKAIQNEFIMSKPDNIPTFIQIRGRAVRKGSHIGLPPENQVVRIKIFTSCLPVKQNSGPDKGKYQLSYEEEKYKEKIASFQVIQKIEKIIHENAIDSIINYEKIQSNTLDDPLGPLPYKPNNYEKHLKELPLSKLKLSTFNIHYAKKEVAIIKIIIKRLFIELSSVWEYNDLFEAVKNPPENYESELNTSLFHENNFLIALSQIISNPNTLYTEPFIYRNNYSTDGAGYTVDYTINNPGDNPGDNPVDYIEGGNGIQSLITEDEYDNAHSSSYFGGNSDLSEYDPDPDAMSFWVNTYEGYSGSSEVKYAANATNPATNNSSKPATKAATKNSSKSATKNNTFKGGNDTNIPGQFKSHAKPASNFIEHLFDPDDKFISLPSGQESIIVSVPDGTKTYFILFPINQRDNMPEIDIEAPYRITKQDEQKVINLNTFIRTKRVDFDYDDKKDIFYRKYADISIENMESVVCEYGTTFHIKFIEECIEYVFRAWTDPTLVKHDLHHFYFKMIYYYDLMSLVMWAYTSKPRIFKEYSDYATPVRAKDIKLKTMAKYESRKEELDDISPEDTSDLATSGVINLLKSTFNRSSNTWIPAEFREQYDETIKNSLSMFEGKKKRVKQKTKVTADLLPIGHYISKFPRIYHPEKGWNEDPMYMQNEIEYKENDILVGFDDRSATGIHMRFKIRNPIHNIKKHLDSRQTEKGTVCKSKSKSELKALARKLNATVPDKINVDGLCAIIKSKLIRLELKERIKKSNLKYFYFFYEQRPETRAM